ncbi:MAG: ArnT family glycosyltransferase [Bacteroidota bacterium]
MISKLRQYYALILFILGVFILFFFKHNDLNLPFYWDEGWVYGKAVRIMADARISIMPNALNYEIGRGHPLLFHVGFATFLKIFGNTILNAHILALIISCLLLLVIYLIAEKTIKVKSGWIISLLVLIQPVFIAQSGLVLPEVLLSIFILLSIYGFTFEKKWLLFISLSIAILIKESAIVVFALLNFVTINNFFSKKWNPRILISKLFWINIPLSFWFIHLLLHKIQFGTFLFHEHADYVSFKWSEMWPKLERVFYFVFLAQGRNILSLSFISIIIYQFIKKDKGIISDKFSTNSIFFIILFILFSSLNYYSDRYAFVCIVLFNMVFFKTIILSSINKAIKIFIISVVFISYGYALTSNPGNSDVNPSYSNVVKNHQEAINYMMKNLNRNDTIYVWFNMKEELQNHYGGFVPSDFYFKNLKTHASDPCRYYLFTNIENPDELNNFTKEFRLEKVKKFETNQAWTILMKKP